jgi:hypothetical protein
MEIPPEVEAKIAQKQQYAWDSGLIQGFVWYVNNVINPTRQASEKNVEVSIGGQAYLVYFEGYVSSSGEYDGKVRLFGETRQLLFQLSLGGYTESSYPQWNTQWPSAQSAVTAFIEGSWVEEFLSHLSALKLDRKIKAEQASKTAGQKSVEDLKNRFGIP